MAKGVCIAVLLAVAAVCVNGQGIIPGIPNRCFEPVESGICRAYIPSFHFNPLSGSCECFVYGGCLGNNNRFATLAECMSTCSVRPELQFNTPSCDMIFRENNPLASFQQSPHQTGTVGETRQPQTETQTQTQQTGTELSPTSTSAKPQQMESQPAETTTKTVKQSESQPEESETQPEESESQGEESETQAEESEAASGGSRTIASLVIGTTGVRPGTITIGQPVFIPSFSKN